MFLKKLLSHGQKEQKVVDGIEQHIRLLARACELFKGALETGDRKLVEEIVHLERQGDAARRDIIGTIYEGAFLPYLRPNLCKFVENVDHVFDLLQETALYFREVALPENIQDVCVQVAAINREMCDMLLITFQAMLRGEDLREKSLAVRIYEKKVDDIKFDLMADVRRLPVRDFWEGKSVADFLTGITSISDFIEDATDSLQVIHLSMR